MSGEPARDALFESLWVKEPPISVEQGWALIDNYAHELAEKIRNEPSPRDPDDYGGLVDMGADWAADLIDPEVLNSGG